MDIWPTELPQNIFVDGYQDGMPDGRLKSSTDTGPGKQRRRTSARPRIFSGRMRMTEEQLLIMMEFIDVTLAGGALPFNWKDPITSAISLVRFGDNLPTWSFEGTKYDVALQIEILP